MKHFSDDAFKALDPLSIANGLNPYGANDPNVFNMFKLGPSFYRSYIQQKAMFVGGGRVLDLLSGFGLWSMFLAEVNNEVIGIDVAPNCKIYGDALAKFLEVDNVKLLQGDVSRTKTFSKHHFDYVWMYSAMQYVNRHDTLNEIHRVLRPGGRLFIGNYNSQGLMLAHLMNGVENQKINEGASQWALNALVHGPLGNGNPNFGTLDAIGAVCEAHGFRLIAASAQGGLDLSSPGGTSPNFKPSLKYEHYHSTIELVAERP